MRGALPFLWEFLSLYGDTKIQKNRNMMAVLPNIAVLYQKIKCPVYSLYRSCQDSKAPIISLTDWHP